MNLLVWKAMVLNISSVQNKLKISNAVLAPAARVDSFCSKKKFCVNTSKI